MNESAHPTASVLLDLKTFELEPGTTLIEASAGTGKTYTIQYIVLDLLFKGLELSEILIVTFTEAATQELRERLQHFLFEVDGVLAHPETMTEPLASVLPRAEQCLGADAVRRVVRQALLHSDEAAIYTIHGFCQRALQENAFAADVAFESVICTEEASIVEHLVRDFQRRVHLSLPCAMPPSGAFNTLCERARKLTGFLRMAQPSSVTIEGLGQAITDAVGAIRGCSDAADTILAEFLSFEGKLNAASYRPAFFTGFERLLQTALTDPESIKQDVLKKLTASQITSKFKKTYKDAGKTPEHHFFVACEALLEARLAFEGDFLACFDTWFVAQFNAYKVEQGIITYDDMIALLDRALPKSPALQSQLRERYRAALVDEFQDTDARQYNIFRTLFAPEGESAAATYFAMIGDPKQSIYGFRGADIGAYLSARTAALHRYTLPTNYRSEAALIEACNVFFAGSNLGEPVAEGIPAERAIQFEAVLAPAARPGKARLVFAGGADLPRVYEQEIDSNAEKAGDLLKTALKQTAQDIAHLLGQSEKGLALIETDSDAGVVRRPLRPGDIAVLVDTHKEAAAIQEALRGRDLLGVLRRAGDVFASAEAAQFLNFLRACLDPREQWIHTLFVSPLYGMTDRKLRELSDATHQLEYERYCRLGRAWKDGASVGKIWADFLYEIHARKRILIRPEGERIFTNYLHLGELAREMERRDALSPERVADRILENVKAGSSGDRTPDNPGLVRLECDDDAIQVMTLHSSKGLEFPVVFLPSLWQKTVRKNSRADLQPEVDPGDPDTLIALKADGEALAQRLQSESLRLGYVALTRAVHFCVYYNAPSMPIPSQRSNHCVGWFDLWMRTQRAAEDGANDGPPARRFLEALESGSAMDFAPVAPAPELASRGVGRSIPDSYQITSYSRLSRMGKHEDSSADPSVPGGAEEAAVDPVGAVVDALPEAAVAEQTLSLETLPGGTHTGTCLHEIMEACDFTRPEEWESVARLKLRRHYPGGSDDVLENRIQSVLEVFKRLSDPELSSSVNLAKLSRADCLHEMEFYFPVHAVDVAALESVIHSWAARQGLEYSVPSYGGSPIDGFLTGSIDLFFEQGGRYYVLDWKTNSPLPGQSRDCTSYTMAGMHAQMCHGRYYLQALIYSVAAAAYLRDQLGAAFDWDRHMGGFIYCFMRGLSGRSGWLQSAFTEAELRRAAVALGQIIEREPGEAHAHD